MAAVLPEKVLVEILSRLPVESLVRFKCVCKSWYDLFSNIDFVSKHTNQSEDDIIISRYIERKGNTFSFVSKADEGYDNEFCIDDLELYLNSKLPYFDCGRRLILHGHWNGIFALSDIDHDIYLCNPAIREFRVLPQSCFAPFPRCTGNESSYGAPKAVHSSTNAIGFGYDCKTNDSKVVRIVSYWADPWLDTRLPSKAEVFSMSKSTWKEIENPDIGLDLGRGNGSEIFCNGVYYWEGREFYGNDMLVLSFDMVDEVFSKATYPEEFQEKITAFGVFNNESFAVFVYPVEDEKEQIIEVWVMKEFGKLESWTKKLTIPPVVGLQRPLMFWKNDKEMLLDMGGDMVGRRISSFNLATQEIEDISIDGGCYGSLVASTYKKTLVSVKAREEENENENENEKEAGKEEDIAA